MVLAAAEVDEALRTVDERGEQVGSDDVDRQHLRSGVNAGVVDHSVHPAEAVHVAGDMARLLDVGEIADDNRRAAVQEVADGRQPTAVADVDDDPVPIPQQRLRGQPSETVCGTGDEDVCRQILPDSSPSVMHVPRSRLPMVCLSHGRSSTLIARRWSIAW
jgi:hypothetical protein